LRHVQLEEQQRAEEAAARTAAEAAREAALQEAYEASLPDDIKERVMLALEREVVSCMHSLAMLCGRLLIANLPPVVAPNSLHHAAR
jgi:hypothetical protein